MITFYSNMKGLDPSTASESSNTHTCDLTKNNHFKVNANNASTIIDLTNASSVKGQAGTIVITNPASIGSLSFETRIDNTESYVKVPGASAITYNTTASNVHLISYYVNDTDQVLVNYIGKFG